MTTQTEAIKVKLFVTLICEWLTGEVHGACTHVYKHTKVYSRSP